MIARFCDKCHKIVKEPTEFWSTDPDLFNPEPYEAKHDGFYTCDQDTVIKIRKQVVVMKIGLFLECGEPVDICNSCANKIIKKKVNTKKKKKK